MKNLFYSLSFYSLFLCFSSFSFAQQEKSKTPLDRAFNYSYQVTLGDQVYERSLRFQKNSKKTTLEAYDKTDGKDSLTILNSSGNLLKSVYTPPKERQTQVEFNYKTKKLLITGKKKKQYTLSQDLFTSGALYYLDSSPGKNLKKGKSTAFYLLQAKTLKKTKMRFTYLGEENFALGKEKILARKYEMKLQGFLEAIFWPHKYYFWYDSETGVIIKYQGKEESRKMKTIVLQSRDQVSHKSLPKEEDSITL